MSISFYGLLIVPENGERTANLSAGETPLDTYLRCGALSARSFAHFGYDWTLITDRPELLAERCKALGVEPPSMRGAEFSLDVPADIPFRAAHHKLELIEKFGTGEFGSRAALVDLDTVCVRPIALRSCSVANSARNGGAENFFWAIAIPSPCSPKTLPLCGRSIWSTGGPCFTLAMRWSWVPHCSDFSAVGDRHVQGKINMRKLVGFARRDGFMRPRYR